LEREARARHDSQPVGGVRRRLGSAPVVDDPGPADDAGRLRPRRAAIARRDRGVGSGQGELIRRPVRECDHTHRHGQHGPRSGADRERRRLHLPRRAAAGPAAAADARTGELAAGARQIARNPRGPRAAGRDPKPARAAERERGQQPARARACGGGPAFVAARLAASGKKRLLRALRGAVRRGAGRPRASAVRATAERLAPGLGGAGEVGRRLAVPVLAEVPRGRRGSFARGSRTLSGAEYEAYQTLHAALKMQLPPTQQQIVLVTSALHGEGKTEVTAGLGLALSQAGLRTWLVSADMRWPRLHELFDVDQSPGLAEVLAGARIYRDGVPAQLAPDHPVQYRADTGRGSLHVLASGSKPRDPAKLLASDALDTFFDQIKRSDYDYVLLDGPPLIGLVDSQVLAQR